MEINLNSRMSCKNMLVTTTTCKMLMDKNILKTSNSPCGLLLSDDVKKTFHGDGGHGRQIITTRMLLDFQFKDFAPTGRTKNCVLRVSEITPY